MITKNLGYICATVLGIAMLIIDGDIAFMYCCFVGAAMAGVDYLQAKKANQ